jgi:predicted nucleic acid-binding protein
VTPAQLVLDTDIVIHLLKKQEGTVQKFLGLVGQRAVMLISPVVVAEVYAGAFPSEHADIEAFFGLCQRIDIDHTTARVAGLYAKTFAQSHQGISLEDFLLAAAAKLNRCPLWTGNRKHYPMGDIQLFNG